MDIPDHPSKKAMAGRREIKTGMKLSPGMEPTIYFMPEVISIRLKKNPLVIPNSWKIPIKTEKNMIYPPTEAICFKAAIIALVSCSPKGTVSLGICLSELCPREKKAFFPYIRNKAEATVRDAARCVNRSKKPILVERHIAVPTEPTIKAGPALLIKAEKISAFFLLIFPFL